MPERFLGTSPTDQGLRTHNSTLIARAAVKVDKALLVSDSGTCCRPKNLWRSERRYQQICMDIPSAPYRHLGLIRYVWTLYRVAVTR